MAIKGRLWGAKYGVDSWADAIIASGASTFAMATLDYAIAFRFTATQAKDIASVRIYWGTVTAAGQVKVRIETIDATSGKPTGTLYDANAEKTAVVPTAGIQTITFDSVPTTNLTPGTQYAVVIQTTTGGTAHTINRVTANHSSTANYPTIVLTTTTGGTPSSFAEVSNSMPLCSLVLDDSTEDPMGMLPFTGTTVTTGYLITNAGSLNAKALLFVTDVVLKVAGVEFFLNRNGTPTSDIRIRIFDSSNATVSGSTYTIDKDSMTAGSRRVVVYFGGLVTLIPGTYRIVFDASADTAGANCFALNYAVPLNDAAMPASFKMSTCPDVTTPTWTDTFNQVPVRLLLDNILPPSYASFQLGV